MFHSVCAFVWPLNIQFNSITIRMTCVMCVRNMCASISKNGCNTHIYTCAKGFTIRMQPPKQVEY